MKKLQGPLLYDSLDKENSSGKSNGTVREANHSTAIITTIITVGLLIAIFFTYIIRQLEYRASTGDILAERGLVALFITALLAIAIVLTGGSYTLVALLQRIVKMKGMLSLQDGPHYDATTGISKEQFDALASMMYTAIQVRASQSKFHGVSTLTLDESRHGVPIDTKEPSVANKTPLTMATDILGD